LVNGAHIEKWLQSRAAELLRETRSLPDPNISILIRTRNDETHVKRLFEDLRAQVFGGQIEVIVVDTESHDSTVAYAKAHGAKIISLTQHDFTYPKALNMGFRAAKYPWVMTLVGHSSLSNKLALKSLTYWVHRDKNLVGIYGLPLANWNASVWERLENIIVRQVWKKPRHIDSLSIGVMGANCSIVERETWQQLGGYDERYAAGGEDRAFARAVLDHGGAIIREPLCSVFHSHGLNLANTVKQWLHWLEVAKRPAPFSTHKVHSRRPDLR